VPEDLERLAAKDSFQVGQTAKVRSGCRVQSLREGHGRQDMSLPKFNAVAVIPSIKDRF
jgi:hypothetical protein